MARLRTTTLALASALILLGCATDPADDGDDRGGDGGGGEIDQGVPEEELADPVFPTEHPRIYVGAHRDRLKAALAANTPAAAKFRERVDQWVGGADLWAFEAWNAALMGVLADDPKYCAKAISEVEAQVVAAEAKIRSGVKPEVANNSYLHVGGLIGDLALVYDWCHEGVSQGQRDRWIAYANQAVHNVWHPESSTWGGKDMPWTGWAVDNPANNYYYSFLRATMLLGLATKGENPRADEWIEQFRRTKLGDQLVPMFEAELVGGGSREGTGYGVAMRGLFELYDFWYATTGEEIARLTGHTRSSPYAFIHQTMPTLDRVAPIGDHARERTGAFFDYHRNYLQELAHINASQPVAGRAKTLIAESTVPAMTLPGMVVYDFLYDDPEIEPQPLAGLHPTYHARGIGQVYARSGWDRDATWVGMIAGPFTEGHAHQDQGSFLVFKGDWLAHDGVVHTRSGIVQDTGMHALVRIDSGGAPVKQVMGTTSKLEAVREGEGYLYVAADVTAAYKGNPAVQKVQRDLLYLRPDVVIVYDRVETAAGTTQTWQLPTPVSPELAGNTATIRNGGHAMTVTRVEPASAAASRHTYGGGEFLTTGYRLDERVAGGANRFLHVLAIDGAATGVTAAGEGAVTVRLADGGEATVAFDPDGPGATLTLGGQTTELTPGIDTLPR